MRGVFSGQSGKMKVRSWQLIKNQPQNEKATRHR